MYAFIKIWAALSIFFLGCCANSTAQCPKAFQNCAQRFDQLSASSFSFLDDILGDVKIVGYGEDTHGTAELTLLAEELMKYLATNHGFGLFILETGFGEGVYLNDYIHGKQENLDSILNVHNSTWRYSTEEFVHLMESLKKYNQENNHPIHLYGCEMQYVLSDIDHINAYLEAVNYNYKINGFKKHIWQEMTSEELSADRMNYEQIHEIFLKNKDQFIALTSQSAYASANLHIKILGQFLTVVQQDTIQRKRDLRDYYMAENIATILEHHGNSAKALYWAHNAHVGDWINNGMVEVAGLHLRKKYGNQYFNLATDLGTSSYIAFPHNANEVGWKFETFVHDKILENTFTQCLQTLGKPNAFLHLRAARKNESLNRFLHSPIKTMAGAGAQARSTDIETNDIGRAFDGIIYINHSNPITWLKNE